MNLLPIILLAVTAVAIILTLAISYPSLTSLRRIKTDIDSRCYNPESDKQKAPSVTVVAYYFDSSADLHSYLEVLYAQDYPNYSVVVVADVSATTTEAAEMRKSLSAIFPDVHFTFIPPNSHNLSRRKLAFTLGIKAAKGKYVLTTTCNCRPDSTRWLSMMMSPVILNPEKEIVLGLTYPNVETLSGLTKLYRQFDFTMRTLQWLGAATRRPIRGDGFNLLFSRSLFFDAKGYSGSVHLNPGDDDIFLTEIATRKNTAILLSEESRLEQKWGDATGKVMRDMRERYAFTARHLPKAPFLKAAIVSWTQWIAIGAAVATTIITLPQWIPTVIATAILLGFWTIEIILYRMAAPWVGSKKLLFSLIPFLLWHPIGNFLFSLRRHRTTRLQYTCRY